MAAKCRAKNPATCKNHGVPPTATNPANEEAAKKEFFGEGTWDSLASVEDQAKQKIMREVSNSFRNSSRDIEGFTGSETIEGWRKLTAILTNPDLKVGSEQAGDDSSNAVREVRQYFKDNHDGTNDGGPSALATVRLFKSLKRAQELGEGIREEALLQAQKPAVTAGFEARAEGIVSLFRKHGILGTLTSKQMDREQRSFIMQVEEQAKGKHSKKPVEIMYRLSDMKVSVWASMENEVVSINKMQIVKYPYSNSSYDENKFAQDLTRIYNSDSYTKETQTYQRKL